MPEVTLIDYTGKGHPDPLYAAKLLAYTKNTRLEMTPGGFELFQDIGEDRLREELQYMAGTIPSSWEFVSLTFSIERVSRATAQQITRTRTASFAMQSQRVTNMSDVTWDTYADDGTFDFCMRSAILNYNAMIEDGMSLENARDILPIGVHCNLVAKYNLRSLVDLVIARESIRVQGPYRNVIRQMKAATLEVWPWAETFFAPRQEKALAMLQEVAEELAEAGAVYKGPAGKVAKAIDLIKKG